jgi:hypothetical protein
MRLTPIVLAMACFALCAFAPPAWAESVDQGPLKRNNWTISVVPYLWALSLGGDVGVKGVDADVDLAFGDILKKLNAALMLDFLVHKGRLGLFVSPLYSELQGEETQALLEGSILQQNIKVDATLKMLILGFGLGYRLGPYPLGIQEDGRTPAVIVEPYLGGRWTDLEMKLDLTGRETRSSQGSTGWADPMIGVMTAWNLYPRWSLTLNGDIGGFGIGSDLAWSVTGLAGYRFHFSERIMGNVQLGYRALYQDFESDSGSGFKYDTTMHGPYVGVSIDFGQW